MSVFEWWTFYQNRPRVVDKIFFQFFIKNAFLCLTFRRCYANIYPYPEYKYCILRYHKVQKNPCKFTFAPLQDWKIYKLGIEI